MKDRYCKHCGRKILDHHVSLGDFCMGCERKEMDVYEVRLADETNGNWYVEKDIDCIKDMLAECDEGNGYTITKARMSVVTYYNLPEFMGF